MRVVSGFEKQRSSEVRDSVEAYRSVGPAAAVGFSWGVLHPSFFDSFFPFSSFFFFFSSYRPMFEHTRTALQSFSSEICIETWCTHRGANLEPRW